VRVLFAGSPALAVPSLLAVAGRHDVVGVLTNPDAPRGRGLERNPTAVAEAARAIPGCVVLSPDRLGPGERAAVAALEPDILAVFAYGRIFGPKFLSLFPEGGVNVHPSLLPKYRGCAPIPFAILDRAGETGVSVQRIALEMDSGDILARLRIPLDGRETCASLTELASREGAALLVRALDEIERGTARGEPQDPALATYTRMLGKEDADIPWTDPAASIDAMVRAFDPWPVASTTLRGARLSVLEARIADAALSGGTPTAAPGTVLRVDKSLGIVVQTGEGLVALTRLQLHAKKALGFREFANGVRDLAGTVLGT